MAARVGLLGFRAGLAAFASTLAYDLAQVLQVAGVLRFPADEILIYAGSLCIVVPLLLEMVALHQLTPPGRQFWTLSSLVFTVIYAVFVTANYVVQLATVIPGQLRGDAGAVAGLQQLPHSVFWDLDAVGYVAMGLACLLAVPAVRGPGLARWARRSLIAHGLVTPLIAIVYFSPTYSTRLLLLGFPWALTAPLFMLMLALWMRAVPGPESPPGALSNGQAHPVPLQASQAFNRHASPPETIPGGNSP